MDEANLWVLLLPAEARGRWTARVLNFDVVVEGSCISDALALAQEEALQVIQADLGVGRDPMLRPGAPEAHWALLTLTLRHGRPLSALRDHGLIDAAAAQIHVAAATQPALEDLKPSPVPCQLATLRRPFA